MSRQSAINVVVLAVHTALDVAALRSLCIGGVHRGRGPGRTAPYVDLSGASEEPWDTMGRMASVVTVPVNVVTSGTHPDGDEQAASIVAKAIELGSAVSTVTGWTVCQVLWSGSELRDETDDDGLPLCVSSARLQLWVEPTV